MTVAELLSRISSRELSEWSVIDKVEKELSDERQQRENARKLKASLAHRVKKRGS